MWAISILALLVSVFNALEFFKARLNRVQNIKVSVRRLVAEYQNLGNSPLDGIVKVGVGITVLILNDGTRSSFVDRLEVRLDSLALIDRKLDTSNQALLVQTPHQFGLLPLPLIHNSARARYDKVEIKPSFPHVIKPDDYVAVEITGVLCFENRRDDKSHLRLPAKLSLHVVYFDAEGRLASTSLLGGTIVLFEHPRADPQVAGYPNTRLQTVLAYNGLTAALARAKQRGSVLRSRITNFVRNAYGKFSQQVRNRLASKR